MMAGAETAVIEAGTGTDAIATMIVDGKRGDNMRYILAVLLGVLCSVSPAAAQVSIGIGLPSVSIGINLPVFPELVVVPNYPVYYAPRGNVNLFFYDGLYWAYQGDEWYSSSWYNGPWGLVGPEYVPAFILRVPVRYYRQPPVAWVGWRSEAPPRWGERWGHDWEQRRSGWDRWDRGARLAPAPLPVYQRQYTGDRYPRVEQQRVLERERYSYQPQDSGVRQYRQQRDAQQPQRGAPAPAPAPTAPALGGRATPRERLQSPPPAIQSEQPRSPSPAVRRDQPAPAAPVVQREQPKPPPAQRPQPQRGQEKNEKEQDQDKGQDQDRGPGREKGQGRNR